MKLIKEVDGNDMFHEGCGGGFNTGVENGRIFNLCQRCGARVNK